MAWMALAWEFGGFRSSGRNGGPEQVPGASQGMRRGLVPGRNPLRDRNGRAKIRV